ncbi:nitroreductase family protein [Pseudooceanicola batsensis HTCC2597]|uniref:Putative NAD(P)H nitroreductase n=1 Tax=Pseudooceanicola batsensis (strain ATCC BAA-863 / DSM 15984 / KCTC 12145 / HTCC2597) TaxID=252305 RepID=A3TTD7_PSEBH|nr:nitroreductase [Pseudooceanicola batsensis]EAQ04914.1 nitroreductase family protein [Pseudooceanicola batsensis HTCC2597]
MPEKNQAALDFLATRRSHPPKLLTEPVPDRAQLEELLTIAARSPDHGALIPWRFVVIEQPAMQGLAELAEARGRSLGKDEETVAKGRGQFDRGNLAVAVVECPVEAEKVPPREQTLSAGAVCLSLVNAALASGWGAGWVTGWVSFDRGFVEQGLGLRSHEQVAGIVHIGSFASAPAERPRPEVKDITTWLSA